MTTPEYDKSEEQRVRRLAKSLGYHVIRLRTKEDQGLYLYTDFLPGEGMTLAQVETEMLERGRIE